MFTLTFATLAVLTAAPELTTAEKAAAYRSTGVRLLDPVELDLQPIGQPVQPMELAAAPVSGSGLWVVTGAVSGALAAAFAGKSIGRQFTSYNNFGRDRQLEGILIGSLIGVTVGYVAGYFAKKGYLAGRIATIALLVFAHGAVAGDVALEEAAQRNRVTYGGGGWGW